jgi:hypothetical protein
LAVFREGAAAAACGHVDNALSRKSDPPSRALTTCPQDEQKKKQTDSLAA